MKSLKTSLIMLLMALFTVSAAWCDVPEELLVIDKELAVLSASNEDKDMQREKELKARELELFAGLLKSEEAAANFLQLAASSDTGLAARFMSRLRFEVTQEGRSDLKFLLEDWASKIEGESAQIRSKKKVAFIYGSEVNLLDGQWHNAPDGRRFWISNEYPDIILSPAEYQKYLKSATVVED